MLELRAGRGENENCTEASPCRDCTYLYNVGVQLQPISPHTSVWLVTAQDLCQKAGNRMADSSPANTAFQADVLGIIQHLTQPRNSVRSHKCLFKTHI
ncbi:hypothetical protein XELAEV_18002601mg [Xenopus laevis]|nr:hypothetical protein XELAEV_18002601mg [Xenopus laevis]